MDTVHAEPFMQPGTLHRRKVHSLRGGVQSVAPVGFCFGEKQPGKALRAAKQVLQIGLDTSKICGFLFLNGGKTTGVSIAVVAEGAIIFQSHHDPVGNGGVHGFIQRKIQQTTVPLIGVKPENHCRTAHTKQQHSGKCTPPAAAQSSPEARAQGQIHHKGRIKQKGVSLHQKGCSHKETKPDAAQQAGAQRQAVPAAFQRQKSPQAAHHKRGGHGVGVHKGSEGVIG